MIDKNKQNERELDCNSLADNQLDDLDTESENPDHAEPITIGKEIEQVNFREAVKFSNNGTSIELYSSCTPTNELASLCLWLTQNIKQEKKPQGYVN